MNRIASTGQLEAELRAIAAYAASPLPSRVAIARRLEELAGRVAASFTFDVGDRVRVKLPGVFRRGEVVRVVGRFVDPVGFEKYVVRGGRGDLDHLSVEGLDPV